jgi:hypothetical protein
VGLSVRAQAIRAHAGGREAEGQEKKIFGTVYRTAVRTVAWPPLDGLLEPEPGVSIEGFLFAFLFLGTLHGRVRSMVQLTIV